MDIYNLKMIYQLGNVTAAGTKLCRTELVGESIAGGKVFEYSFEDNLELNPFEPHDFDEPLLRVTEKLNPVGQVTHLIFKILSWDGLYLGILTWGSNLYPVWPLGELTKPVGLNIGKEKAISINLIIDPLAEEEPVWPPPPPPPPEPEPSLWEKVPWYAKVTLLVGVPLLATWGLVTRKRI